MEELNKSIVDVPLSCGGSELPPACTVFSQTQDRKQCRTDRLSVTSQFVLAKGDKFTLLFTPTGNFEFLSSDLRVSGLWEENDGGSRKHIQTD